PALWVWPVSCDPGEKDAKRGRVTRAESHFPKDGGGAGVRIRGAEEPALEIPERRPRSVMPSQPAPLFRGAGSRKARVSGVTAEMVNALEQGRQAELAVHGANVFRGRLDTDARCRHEERTLAVAAQDRPRRASACKARLGNADHRNRPAQRLKEVAPQ